MRNYDRRSANTNHIDRSEFACDFNVDSAGTVHEIALLNNKSISSVARLDISRAVMHEVSSQRAGGAARCRVFRNVVGRRKQARVRARFANLDRLATERVAAG